MKEYNLRVAIFGAGGSIGSEFVRSLASNDRVEQVIAYSGSFNQFNNSKVIEHSIDISDENSIKSAAEIIDQDLDLIIVATGMLHDQEILPEKSLKEISAAKFEKLFKINSIAPAIIAKYFVPKLSKENQSIFAAISARVSSISDNHLGGWYSYRASKSALNMILKNLAIEISRSNKKAIILGLHPGTVDSKLSEPFKRTVPEGKLFSPNYSVQKMLEVVFAAKIEDSGSLIDYSGAKIDP